MPFYFGGDYLAPPPCGRPDIRRELFVGFTQLQQGRRCQPQATQREGRHDRGADHASSRSLALQAVHPTSIDRAHLHRRRHGLDSAELGEPDRQGWIPKDRHARHASYKLRLCRGIFTRTNPALTTLHGAIPCALIESGHILIVTGHQRAARPRDYWRSA